MSSTDHEQVTSFGDDGEKVIVASVLTNVDLTRVDIDAMDSLIENSADLLRKYSGTDECLQEMFTFPDAYKIFLIVSSPFVATLLPKVHDLPVLQSVYIYGEALEDEEAKKYTKIAGVFTDLEVLTTVLCPHVDNYIRNAQLPMSIFKQRYEEDRSFNDLNPFAYFADFWYPLLIDVILDLPRTHYEQEKRRFIEQCRIYYRANTEVLKQINSFEKDYTPDTCISWYKSTKFVYRLLNRLMRQQNIEGILSIRFVIVDIHVALQSIYQQFISEDVYRDQDVVTVYRGQWMFVDEIAKLQRGATLSINSVFSASRTEDVAKDFVGVGFSGSHAIPTSQRMRRVLLEINIPIDHQLLLQRRLFADVSHLPDRKARDECEVIFTPGFFFRLESIRDGESDNTPVTCVTLTLVNENNPDNPIMKDYKVLGSPRTLPERIVRLGNLLVDHGQASPTCHSKEDSFYKFLLRTSDPEILTACRVGQAWAAFKRNPRNAASDICPLDQLGSDELRVTALNCLAGTYLARQNYPLALRYYQQAYDLCALTDEKLVAKSYRGPCIPIDKHAMYDDYRNIASINIARIYQRQGETQQAWEMFKKIVDCDMRELTDFHCHVCMTIAEVDMRGVSFNSPPDIRILRNWQRFLDLGLTDLLKYRMSVIAGCLSFSYRYDSISCRYNNQAYRTMAIEYLQKVAQKCLPQAENEQFYRYTLQCYERLGVLYRHSNDPRSVDNYEKMIQLCLTYHPDDRTNIIAGYAGLLKAYQQQQLLDRTPNNNEAIDAFMCSPTNDLAHRPNEISSPSTARDTLFDNSKPLHFAFDYDDHRLDSRLKSEADIPKKIIYCHLKLAALYYKLEKTEKARYSLSEAMILSQKATPILFTAIQICGENLAFMRNDFEPIIESYTKLLSTNRQQSNGCIDEHCYGYIAHLHVKNSNNLSSALQSLQEPIDRFEKNDYVCAHTIRCCIELADFYQFQHNDLPSVVNTYARTVELFRKHRPGPMATLISLVKRYLIEPHDHQLAISVYKKLCALIAEETTDTHVFHTHMKPIWGLFVKKYDAYDAVLDSYDAFLNLILQHIGPLTSRMATVVRDYRYSFTSIYKHAKHRHLAIQVYQKLLILLLKRFDSRTKIIQEYKVIGAEMIKRKLFDESIYAYELLMTVACRHPTPGRYSECDLIQFVFYVWKDKIISEYLNAKKFDAAIRVYYRMIRFLENYRLSLHPTYDRDEFVDTILKKYDEIATITSLKQNDLEGTMRIYVEQIDFLTKYRIESVQKQIDTIFSLNCSKTNFAWHARLLEFLEDNRLDYLSHLFQAYRELAQLDPSFQQYPTGASRPIRASQTGLSRLAELAERVSDYKLKAAREPDRAIQIYRQELLPFLLESHARDDEQIAKCYLQMASPDDQNNYEQVVRLYERQTESFYTRCAFEFNPNVCRRFAGMLFICYNRLATLSRAGGDSNASREFESKAIEILVQYREQFLFVANIQDQITTIETRPFVELGY